MREFLYGILKGNDKLPKMKAGAELFLYSFLKIILMEV
jgi:hypothetical protein